MFPMITNTFDVWRVVQHFERYHQMDLMEKLKEQGWYLTEEGIKKLADDVDRTDSRKVIHAAMDMDFREIAGGALSEISRKEDSMPGRIVLQITKIRNISAPKANEEWKVAPRFLQLELTDGVSQVFALEFESIPAVSLNTPPGTKVYLKSEKLSLMQGTIMLRPHDIQILGGKVAALVEKWEMSRALLKYTKGGRINTGPSGPPPWIPFGQKIQQTVSTDKNFKSLSQNPDKDKDAKENNEFEVMRNEAIAEAAKVTAKKVFGGGNQQIVDHNVKKIMEKGFTDEQAKNALKVTRNNLERALYNLKRQNEFKAKEDTRPIVKRGARDVKKLRGEENINPTKPAGNLSLFDFLTDKLPANADSNDNKPERKGFNEPLKSASSFQQNHSQQHYHSQSQQHSKGESLFGLNQTGQSGSNSSIPNNQSNRPKFENNISSSFANRSASNVSDNDINSYRDRNRNVRGGSAGEGRGRGGGSVGGSNSNYNSYPPRHHESNDRYRNDQRNQNNRSQRTNDRNNSNYQNQHHVSQHQSQSHHNQQQSHSSSTYDSRNRNDYKTSSYDKSKVSGSKYPPKESGNNNHYQSKQPYKDNRSSNYNSNLDSKMTRLAEETAKMKIDKPQRNSSSYSSSTSQMHRNQPSQQQQSATSLPPSTSGYAQLPNGFAYDPSKIMGFQSKETNEFAMSMLKNQNINASMPPPPPVTHPQFTGPPPPPQQMQVPPPPTQPSYPPSQFMMQAQPQASFGMNQFPTDGGWNWKIGDRCLAKYWDDGGYYEAEITGISDSTCVVWFVGYGNHEEVLKSDCLPITDAQHRPINFSKMNDGQQHGHHHIHHQQHQHPHHHQGGVNRGGGGGPPPNRNRNFERQMYVPPPKREN